MSSVVDTLVEMGFSREKAELARSRCGSDNLETIMDWILTHEDDLNSVEATTTSNVDEANSPNVTDDAAANIEEQPDENNASESLSAKSIKCNDCGKLFKTQDEVEFHAVKLGHENFSESTEEKKPLTEEEKKEQLAKIEAKLKQRRQEREMREKQDELEREKNRIKSGKEMLEAKKKYEDLEMKKILEQRKREKEEERLARQRVKEQIEQDKMARKEKFAKESPPPPPVTVKSASPSAPKQLYTQVHLQIRLIDGKCITQTFQNKEPLANVRLYVEMNRENDTTPFNLMTTFPRRIFTEEDYQKPLDSLGLAPSAVLIVCKAS